MKKKWDVLAQKEHVERAMTALQKNGIVPFFVENAAAAKDRVLSLLPKGSGVMNMTSFTLETTGIAQEILESGNYTSVRNALNAMDRNKENREMQKLGAAPEWAVGSVHAVTEEGQVMIASNTGSQLSAYAYGADHVIWVAGTQKLVKNVDEGWKRIYEHSLPLESERAKKAYGVPGSAVNKLLIINNEVQPGRLHLILVNEVLGF